MLPGSFRSMPVSLISWYRVVTSGSWECMAPLYFMLTGLRCPISAPRFLAGTVLQITEAGSNLLHLLQPSIHRFQPGNAGFISIYILNNALDYLLRIGIERIERHALELSGVIYAAVKALGFELMTPHEDAQRAGNVCFMTDNLEPIKQELERQQVLIWGAYAGFGRLRISTHLYNDSEDVERCIAALQNREIKD